MLYGINNPHKHVYTRIKKVLGQCYQRMLPVEIKSMKKNIENIVRHAEVSEKVIEKYLADSIKTIGGLCLKYSNANLAGYPDRVILLPGGVACWVEVKSKGKKPTLQQEIRHKQLRNMGHVVYVIDSKNKIDELMKNWREGRA